MTKNRVTTTVGGWLGVVVVPHATRRRVASWVGGRALVAGIFSFLLSSSLGAIDVRLAGYSPAHSF